MWFLLLVPVGLTIFVVSYRKSRTDQFYSNTLLLTPLGIYVWGDGLVLGPFWLLVGLGSIWLETTQITTLLLVFYLVRSSYEVIYWLNHQAVKDPYKPPIVRYLAYLQNHEAAIIYQLFHTCIVIVCLGWLLIK